MESCLDQEVYEVDNLKGLFKKKFKIMEKFTIITTEIHQIVRFITSSCCD